MALQLSFGEASATGPRAENQDAMRIVTPAPALAESKGHLFALADGVSQCADGQLAAQATLQALALDYYATPETWSVNQSLDRVLIAHNRWLQANGGGQPLLTTLSALVVRGRRFTLAHIGDCRVYRWFAGKLEVISQDHVWQQPGMQHVLKRAMGLDQHVIIDYLDGELRQGESFLLLTDGVWATLSDNTIASILHDASDPEAAVQALIHAAHLAGSQDNASAMMVNIETLPETHLADTLAQLHQWPAPPVLQPGKEFEGWHVEDLLHQSRQSLMYRVRDKQGQHWLLKTLPANRADEPQAAPALLLEEWFLRRVAGSHFAEVHPLPQRQHLYYLQRQYTGQTLAEMLKADGPLSLADWLRIAPRLIKALGMLHRRNIIHRDIKPENILCCDDGEVRIIDFGLAFCPGLSPVETTTVAGTPSYIAPEAFNGAAPSASQDIFAAGVTLYQALTGHYPYGEIEAFQRPHFKQPTSASRYRPDLPVWVDQQLLHAICADPDERFETAEQWLLELEHGERQSLAIRPRPLLEREPLAVWRTVALIALALNVVLFIALLR
ncbi:protein kinase [Pseudomonas sp. J237]|nr:MULTISPECIES: bifunctional protein-serine/threonine kinase/phosphatase [Pseudomonas]OEO25467.1 protein kinase [Pseudomonas sp. J237]